MRAIVKRRPEPGMDYAADLPEPVAGEDEVLIAVAATSICGVDRHVHEWDAAGQAFVPNLPVVPGHETAGTVRAVGSAVAGIAVGARVALESHLVCHRCFQCRTGAAHLCVDQRILGLSWDGAFAELVRVPASACFPLPDEVGFDSAALFEPAGVAVHATQRADDLAGACVLVSGAGPIGLFVIQLAQLFGARCVLASEVNPYRRALAERLGARTIDPTVEDLGAACRRAAPGRDGVDVAFEASGAAAALPAVLAAVRTGGELITVGHPGIVPVDVSKHINVRYVTWKGVFGRRIWDTWELLAGLVGSGRLDLEWIVTHHVGLDEFDRAIELLGSDAGKILVVPDRG
jgi:threonine 3-dehydrogenase